MDCFGVIHVLMRNKLIDPQFSIPLMNVLTRGSVATVLPYDAAFRGLKHFRESLVTHSTDVIAEKFGF